MKATHQAGAAPCAVLLGAYAPVPWPVAIGVGLACWGVAAINDWDHPNYTRRMHLGAMAVRWSARAGYRIRTRHDRHRTDLHRGPSHSLEWCAMFGLAVGVLASLAFGYWGEAGWGLWFGIAVATGTASHVLLDWMTPSGVPLSALYNVTLYPLLRRGRNRQVWRRHACGWWVPFYEVSFWLRWIRLPRPMAVDESHPGCTPGLFHTDRGGEHMIVVPILYGATGVIVLSVLGILTPVITFLAPMVTAL
jgi:membrane-bound metal-dependent hydrolase YbcI (DUF457 family)